jgi:UDP-N-acetylglucosamine 2-epimerase (non-hydrolysing)
VGVKVAVVVGTRPEALKMAPVIRGLRECGLTVTVVASGQHPELTAGALSAFSLAPDVALPPLTSVALAERLGELVIQLGRALAAVRPDLVLVHGDTSTALAGALAAHHHRMALGHVEAGLRSGDRSNPFPEEDNRRLVDHLATICFAPTPRAQRALVAEGIPADRILVTGNPLVDAVRDVSHRVEGRPCASLPELAPFGLDAPGPVVLVTAHRRESWGTTMLRICAAVEQLPARVLWPVHPSPEVDGPVRARLGSAAHVTLCGPLSYPAMIRALLRADLVLTDSGGVQEEGAILGKPTLVLRETTERPEALECGVVRMVGTQTDDVVATARQWIRRSPTLVAEADLLGDGFAGVRIARWIAAAFEDRV